MDFENLVKMLLPLIESQHLKQQKLRNSAIYKTKLKGFITLHDKTAT